MSLSKLIEALPQPHPQAPRIDPFSVIVRLM